MEINYNLLLLNKICNTLRPPEIRVMVDGPRGLTQWFCHFGSILPFLTVFVMVLTLVFPAKLLAEAPSAKLVVGQIEVISNNIFSEAESDSAVGVLALVRNSMNGLHINTREYVLRRELLFAEGDNYRPELLAETERNLRELGFLNNISVSAVDTTEDGRVNIRVSTRDSWSLKTSFTWSRSSAGETRWNVSLSEVNFLGQAVTMGAGMGADENSSFYSFWFRKRRITSAGMVLGVDYAKRQDGFFHNIFVSRPFYAQADKWSLETRAYDSQADTRFYLSNAGPSGIDPSSEASLYGRIPRQETGFKLGTLVRLSDPNEGRIWRVGLGLNIRDTDYQVSSQPTYELSDGREVDLDYLTEPNQPVARNQGLRVHPHLWVTSSGRNWAKERYILQYGPVEDVPLDLSFDIRTGPSGSAMGSTSGFGGSIWRTEFVATKWWNLGPGMFKLQSWGVSQLGSQENRYHSVKAQTGWLAATGSELSPWLTRITAEAGHGSSISGEEAFTLGLGQGLRTLDFSGMAGDRLLRWNAEQGKVMPWEVLGFFRMGFAAFYSGGVAYWDDEDRDLSDSRHEVGLGMRMGPTRSANALVSKLDISWALDGSRGPVFTATSRGFF